MNFLKTLGGLVGPSATGGLPYSMHTPSLDGNVAGADGAAGESVVFEGLPDFVLHSGKSKHDASQAVSIFKSKQPAGQLTQNALRRIKTLRHPNILAYLDGTEVPNNGPVFIVTEHVMPLSEFLTALRMEYGAHSEEFAMSVSWGLRSILLALQFINVDCKLLHGRLTPQSIFVTKGGDWKLGGFEMTAEMTSDGPSYIYTAFQQYADANYKSPECLRAEWKALATGPPYAVDVWAFACLMYYVFNDGQLRSSEVSTAANIPPAIRTQFRKAIDENPARRPSPQKILSCSYFDTPFIKRMDFLENLAVKTSDEKVAFYKELCANLDSLPRCFGVHKILPALKAVVEFGASTGAKNGPVKLDPSASHMLPAMVQIGSSLSPDEFKLQVLPIIIKLFSCNDRAVRVQLLQMMEKFTVHFDAKLVNSSVVFDNLCSGFTDAAPVLRELTVKSMLHIADKLSDSNLNNRVMKYFAKLQSDPEPAIRTNTTICLGKIAGKLNKTTRPKVLFPAFSRALRDPFPHARLAGLRSMTACEEFFTPQGVAGSIVPAISPLLLDVSISVREQAKLSLETFMKKIMEEAAQMKIREEREAKERELKREAGEDEHVGDTVAPGATSTPPPSAHSSGGYASSLTGWATSAVTSGVGKLVGSGGSSAPSSAAGSAPSSRTSSFTANGSSTTTTQGNAFSTSSASSSKHNSFNAFPVDDFGADDDGWGDDGDLDALDSPKDANAGSSAFNSSFSGAHTGASTFKSPAASSLASSLSSSSSAVKLNVSRPAGSGLSTSTKLSTSAAATFAMKSEDDGGWGDDNWGGDDDFGFDAPAPKKTSSSLSLTSQRSITSSKSSTSTTASTSTTGFGLSSSAHNPSRLTTTTTPPSSMSSSAGPSAGRKTASERRAEAQAKAKAKREPLGAMKLETTSAKGGDEWNWDF